MRTQPHPHPNPALLSLVSKLDACVWGNCWCCNHWGPLQHFGLCFSSPDPTLLRLGLVRFGLVLITYATKLCQLMERGTAAGAAAFAFNRICCADYRYLDIVLWLEHSTAHSSRAEHEPSAQKEQNHLLCNFVCMCVCALYVCVGGDDHKQCHDKLTLLPILELELGTAYWSSCCCCCCGREL